MSVVPPPQALRPGARRHWRGSLFVNIGERTNVTGSKAFARLILAGQFEEALAVARQQVENGAQVIDVNMDEAMLDSQAAMVRFLNLMAGEPEIARVPVMIDSSKWSVIEAGLRCIQGRASSTPSRSGRRGRVQAPGQAGAPLWRRPVVMAFDEQGQADTFARKTEICARAHRILVDEVDFPPRTSSSTPTSSPSRRASRSTTTTRWTSSTPRVGSSRTCPAPRSRAA